MRTLKPKTNEDMIRDLINDLDPLSIAILRERIVKIAEITLKAIDKDPKAYDNPIYDHTYYQHVCNKIIKHCGFNEHKSTTKK